MKLHNQQPPRQDDAQHPEGGRERDDALDRHELVLRAAETVRRIVEREPR